MSFGGGESPGGTTFQTQFTRDAPQIEAAKMGLMGTAQQYARFGMNPWELSTPGAKVGDNRTRSISALLEHCVTICAGGNRGV